MAAPCRLLNRRRTTPFRAASTTAIVIVCLWRSTPTYFMGVFLLWRVTGSGKHTDHRATTTRRMSLPGSASVLHGFTRHHRLNRVYTREPTSTTRPVRADYSP